MAVKNVIYFIAARLFDSSQRVGRSDSLHFAVAFAVRHRSTSPAVIIIILFEPNKLPVLGRSIDKMI